LPIPAAASERQRTGADVPEVVLGGEARAYRNRYRRQRGFCCFRACTLARQIFESLSSVTVLLVGAGETIELVARHLREHKVKNDDDRQPHPRTRRRWRMKWARR
jgi:hypothetical protein